MFQCFNTRNPRSSLTRTKHLCLENTLTRTCSSCRFSFRKEMTNQQDVSDPAGGIWKKLVRTYPTPRAGNRARGKSTHTTSKYSKKGVSPHLVGSFSPLQTKLLAFFWHIARQERNVPEQLFRLCLRDQVRTRGVRLCRSCCWKFSQTYHKRSEEGAEKTPKT